MARTPRRVSLKGKGADIFFGDYAPPGVGVEEPVADTVESAAEPGRSAEDTSPTANQPSVQSSDAPGEQESMHASLLASKQERKQARKQARVQESLPAGREDNRDDPPGASGRGESRRRQDTAPATVTAGDIPETIWTALDQPATITNSFRYLESELDSMADALYEIGKTQGVKLTKQEVARLGLNVVLDDYRRRGPTSLLSQLAARRQRRSGRH